LINNFPEGQIVNLWQRLLEHRTEFVNEEGYPVKIVYPGRINDESGADFRDAVIATGQGLVKGDIEVHVKSSDWQGHRHYQNPSYNRVVLHVVMWRDNKAVTSLQSGETIPILALHKYVTDSINQQVSEESPVTFSKHCFKATDHLTTGIIAELLDRSGKERFLRKSIKFETDLAQVETNQRLYQGIMEALGYSKNKLPFLKLARLVPIQILESIAEGKISSEECHTRQQALLLGAAGLLPSQCQDRHQENIIDDKWVDELERLWACSRFSKSMSRDEWHLFRVRPNNSPIRRIVAMSYLIFRYKERGIFDGIVDLIKGVSIHQRSDRMEMELLVITNDYWASHFDFGSANKTRNPTLLGSQRAADIIINVLLPFVFAWGKITSQPELERKAFSLYRHYPKLATNTVERHMKHQLGINRLVNSAQRQQGLIHIYQTLCIQGRCNRCPLYQLETGNHIQI
jgi:hypothetical protein